MNPIELLKKSLTDRCVIHLPREDEFACLAIARELPNKAAWVAVGRIGKWRSDKGIEYETWTNLTHKALSAFEDAKIDKRPSPEAESDQEELERYMREFSLEPIE